MRTLYPPLFGFLVLSCLVAAVAAQDTQCPNESVQVRNVTLFPECYCHDHQYPELNSVLQRYGLRLAHPGKSAWNEEVRGKTWFYCSINLRWQDDTKRQDKTVCNDDNRKRIVAEITQALAHPAAINSPFLSCR